MAQTHSQSRQRAEIAFDKAQSQLLARERTAEERDSIALARAEKTVRLREARLAMELASASSVPVLKRAR